MLIRADAKNIEQMFECYIKIANCLENFIIVKDIFLEKVPNKDLFVVVVLQTSSVF